MGNLQTRPESEDKKEIATDMHRYVQQLKPTVSAEFNVRNAASAVDADASAPLAALFMSLLGVLARPSQLRADIAVYVVALQRRMKAPKTTHCKRCNRVLSCPVWKEGKLRPSIG